MLKSARPTAPDLRAVARLSHECRDVGDDPAVWRTHLAQGVARLTGAGMVQSGDGRLTACGGASGGFIFWGLENGFDVTALRHMVAELARSASYNPMFDPYQAAQGQENGVCRSRPELVTDREWYTSAYFLVHRALGADAALFCNWRLPGGGESVLILGRPAGEPDFTARQKAIVREAHALIAPLVGGPLAGAADPTPGGLPLRCRQVLRCLLEGDSDKQAATRLGLSRHTVNEYTKHVFRHFGVNTRTELLARWVRRGWGAACGWTDV